jgi:altronate dehydratase small subunit
MKTADQSPEVDAISLAPADNVATLLRAVTAGERLRVRCGSATSTVIARAPIALCHKISLVELAAGTSIVKYGQPIGVALVAIAAGAHVHVHNMRSARARADSRA